MSVLFLLVEDAAQDRTNAESWEHACGEPLAIDLLRSCAAGKLIAGADVAAHRGKRAGGARVGGDLAGGDGSVRAAADMIAQQNQAVGIAERERTQEDTLYEREDRSGGADAESQGEDDGQSEAGCFAKLSKREAEILRERVHASSPRVA